MTFESSPKETDDDGEQLGVGNSQYPGDTECRHFVEIYAACYSHDLVRLPQSGDVVLCRAKHLNDDLRRFASYALR